MDAAGHLAEDAGIEAASLEAGRHRIQRARQAAHHPAVAARPVDRLAAGAQVVTVLEALVAQEQAVPFHPQAGRGAAPFLVHRLQVLQVAGQAGLARQHRRRHEQRVAPPPDQGRGFLLAVQVRQHEVEALLQRHDGADLAAARIQFLVQVADGDFVGIEQGPFGTGAAQRVVIVLGGGGEEAQHLAVLRHPGQARRADVEGGGDPVRGDLRQVGAGRHLDRTAAHVGDLRHGHVVEHRQHRGAAGQPAGIEIHGGTGRRREPAGFDAGHLGRLGGKRGQGQQAGQHAQHGGLA